MVQARHKILKLQDSQVEVNKLVEIIKRETYNHRNKQST